MRNIDNLWGKKSDKEGIFLWLPLSIHLMDTMGVSKLLYEQWLSEGQRQLIKDSLKISDELDSTADEVALNLVGFICGIHDIGKATPVFQTKNYQCSSDLQNYLMENLEQNGFSGISALQKQLANPEKSPHALAGQFLLKKLGVRDDISTIIGAHHGKPIDNESTLDSQKGYEKSYFQSYDSESVIFKKWEETQKEILDLILKRNNFKTVSDLPKIKQSGQVVLLGLLTMADWIASNEYYFPLISIDDDVKEIDLQFRLERGFEKWNKNRELWNTENINKFAVDEIYKERFNFSPRNFQSALSKIIEETNDPGIFVVEAPMGKGKTEAALIASEQLAYKTGRTGIFFGLPTQATSNGIFPRIENWLKSVQKGEKKTVGLRLSHGKAFLNEDFLQLYRESENAVNVYESENDNLNNGITVNQWFAGKKTSSLDDFVVGTVDQFLLIALKQKHLALRHLGFGKKVVIIDEVHAYDAYMSVYLNEAIRWMAAYGVPVVILSATLPKQRRKKLIEEYLRGKGIKWRDVNEDGNEKLELNSYPLISYSDGGQVKVFSDFEKGKDKTVEIKRLDDKDLPRLLESFNSEGIIGIIVNTVKRAQELTGIFSSHFGDSNVCLLHSGFIATERSKKEKELINMIGKNGNRPEFKIIVGTQVLEQSLDIDFDVLITDLAPMDLLIQRIGRLQRHDNKNRADIFKNSKLYVLGTNDEFEFEKGSSFVYGDYFLARTQCILPDKIDIPSDISPLVQKVYDDSDLNLTEDLSKKILSYQRDFEQKKNSKADRAKNYRLDNPLINKETDFNLIGWLENSTLDKTEEHANAQVRDTTDTIEVIALKKVGDGYGFFGEDEDISNTISLDDVTRRIASNTLKLPNIFSYIIDDTITALEKYNSKKLNSWQNINLLKGSLGMIFDERGEFYIKFDEDKKRNSNRKSDVITYKVMYNEKYGVSAVKIEE